MDNVNYFWHWFESIEDYKKIVFLIIILQIDKDLLLAVGFSERDLNHFWREFKNILIKQNEEYLNYIKNQGECIFAMTFEDVRYDR